MPGGDRAAEEPWRMALAYLHHTYGADFEGINLPVLKELRRDDLRFLVSAIEAGINTPLTSSAGRLFDAVAGITGLVLKSRYEAEAAMRLQSTIAATDRTYPFELADSGDRVALDKTTDGNTQVSAAVDSAAPNTDFVIDFRPCIRAIVEDILSPVAPGIIAATFHNTLVSVILESVERMSADSGLNTVALSGGVFQNRYILAKSERALKSRGFTVISNNKIPSNDGGVALGQLAVAANRS